MKNLLKKMFPKMFCQHSYEKIGEQMAGNCGTHKFLFYKCSKCGKEKCEST